MVQAIELGAVVAAAVYGVLLARRHGMDVVGALSLAFIVSFGGGTLRDLFLDRHPLFWIGNPQYPAIVFAIAVAASLSPRVPTSERWLTVPDALGLGLFGVAGAAIARDAGAAPVVASVLAVVGGTFGGVMGDVVCNQLPSLFRPAPLYATCAFAGAWTLMGLEAAGVGRGPATAAAAALATGLRLLAVRRAWTLPNVGGGEGVR